VDHEAIEAAHAATSLGAFGSSASEGMSDRAIAPLAGISHQRVHQILTEDE
jgi:hypothetical protein